MTISIEIQPILLGSVVPAGWYKVMSVLNLAYLWQTLCLVFRLHILYHPKILDVQPRQLRRRWSKPLNVTMNSSHLWHFVFMFIFGGGDTHLFIFGSLSGPLKFKLTLFGMYCKSRHIQHISRNMICYTVLCPDFVTAFSHSILTWKYSKMKNKHIFKKTHLTTSEPRLTF